MLPDEKALVERLKEKPFALIGINSDGPREAVQKVVAEQGLTWRQAVEGCPPGVSGAETGPIARAWRVKAWPTIYVLDAKGVIRHKFRGVPSNADLDKFIDALVKEAK